jgi:hypothetical protein
VSVPASLHPLATLADDIVSSRASPPHSPREDELAHPTDISKPNLASALGLLSRWRGHHPLALLRPPSATSLAPSVANPLCFSTRRRWLPNPGKRAAHELALFRFLGTVMGGMIRTKNMLALDLPPIFWKQLLQEPTTITDLYQIDETQVRRFTLKLSSQVVVGSWSHRERGRER